MERISRAVPFFEKRPHRAKHPADQDNVNDIDAKHAGSEKGGSHNQNGNEILAVYDAGPIL